MYSTNPAYTHRFSERYCECKHSVWCSDKYDPGGAPSSSPCELFISLQKDCDTEDKHSSRINGYKKTFRKLASNWELEGKITKEAKDEIIAEVNSMSWNIWRPHLYIINRAPIETADRLKPVKADDRAALCEEWRITDLDSSEFEIIERVK